MMMRMMAATQTLTEFLTARITEDETDLRAGADLPDDRWTTQRLLAECDAKRRIIERVSDVAWSGSYAVRDVVLELLAVPYADHPDYRDEWRP